mmetsp:Transcript_30372/g.75456  ORF Transcript_30372/g.75456 Transcript_30372/m.75456 type:complete len:242 (-) Transcript_30372:160-885(-)
MSISSSFTAHSSLDSGDTPWHAMRFLADLTTLVACFWRSSLTACTMVCRFFCFAIFFSSSDALAASMPRSAGSVTDSALRSAVPLPSVRRLSAFLRNSARRLSSEMAVSISTPSSFILRRSAMVSVPMAICACRPPSILPDVMPLMIFCASASGRLSCCWMSFSRAARSAVTPLPSRSICSAWLRNALSARPLCTMPISNWLRPSTSPSCARRVNSDWSRSRVMRVPMGALTVSPVMQNIR